MATVTGGGGNDNLSGTGSDDTIHGNDGDDTITASAGNDTAFGGAGNDSLFGGDGADSLSGDAGNDLVAGDSLVTTGPNLIVNGSFEDTTGMNTSPSWGYIGTGGVMPGWTDANGNAMDVDRSGRFGLSATDGANWLDLEGEAGQHMVIGQNVTGITDGDAYVLRFDVGDYANSDDGTIFDNRVQVIWNGEVMATLDPADGGWTTYEFTLIGGSGDGSNRLTFAGQGRDDPFGASLDNIRVFATTEGSAGNDTLEGGDGNDTLIGAAGDDTLNGGTGNDLITGGSGNDSVRAGDGDDVAFGGTGDDTLIGDAGNDSLVGGSGTDVLLGGTGNDTMEGGADVDALYGEDGDDLMSGGSGNDTLTGGAGNDTIDAGADRDIVWVGQGNDLVSGGTGGDIVAFESESTGSATIDGGSDLDGNDSDALHLMHQGGAVSIVFTGDEAGSGTIGGATVTFTEIEHIAASDNNDFIDASADNSGLRLEGLAGNDTITGGGDADLLFGGDGNDSLTGGGGADSLSGDAGDDRLFGGAGVDTIEGGAGNDLVEAGDGNDLLFGGDGHDAIRFGNGDDTAYGGDGNDSFDDVVGGGLNGANLVYGGLGNDTAWAGDGNDTLYGGDGNDRLEGEGGDDLLEGGAGNDLLLGFNDRDTFRINSGDGTDTISGGEGGNDLDTLELSGSGFTVTMTGAEQGTYTNGSGTQGTFSQIESYSLSGLADTFQGGSSGGNLHISSNAGNDQVTTGTGNDTIFAGDGDDTVSAGAGNDQVWGGSGNDSLSGGDGDDSLTGGVGNDTLTTGQGADVLELTVAGGADTVTDFDMTLVNGKTVDQFDVSDLTNASGGPLTWADVIVTDTNGDGTGDAILTFPNGESVVMQGVTPDQISGKHQMASAGIPCFVAGTLILTPCGWRKVEALRAGDLVSTEAGPQRVLWAGHRDLTGAALDLRPDLKPVHFPIGAIGNTIPLRLSPQHAVLMTDATGAKVLVRAKHLGQTGFGGARVAHGLRRVSYHHLLLERHAILNSAGAPTESYYPGPEAVAMLEWPARLALTAAIAASPSKGAGICLDGVADRYGPRAYPLIKRKHLSGFAKTFFAVTDGAEVHEPLC